MTLDALERTKLRIAGRKAAETCWELLEPELTDCAPEYAESFIDEIKRRCGLQEPAPAAENHEPIARLGSHTLNYGEFNGRCLDDIPLDRIDWYLRKAEENAKILGAYMKHPELESRRSAEIGEPI